MLRIYEAWWGFCREYEIPVGDLLKADFTPVHFHIQEVVGTTSVHGHTPVNRTTGTGTGEIWEEKCWAGFFEVQLSGFAFNEPEEDKWASARPVVRAFLQALNVGFASLGGGRSIGHGVVRVTNLDELKSSPVFQPVLEARCPKGHYASYTAASFGGKCKKCGGEIRPAWTIAPGGVE
ncbi:MAG: hypothetical protein AAB451_02615 [Patescibacteria group bacterium]